MCLLHDVIIEGNLAIGELGIGELAYPVTKDNEAVLAGKHKVELYVAMTKDEVVNLGMFLQVLFGEEDKMLFFFAHIGWLSQGVLGRRCVLYTTVLSPLQAKGHTKVGMQPAEGPLAEPVVEDGAQEAERLALVAQPVAMCQEECLACYLDSLGLVVHDNAALLSEIVLAPDIVIACKEVNGNAHIREF